MGTDHARKRGASKNLPILAVNPRRLPKPATTLGFLNPGPPPFREAHAQPIGCQVFLGQDRRWWNGGLPAWKPEVTLAEVVSVAGLHGAATPRVRSGEHTSELQSPMHL